MNKKDILAFVLAILLAVVLIGGAWAADTASGSINWQVMSGGGASAQSSSGALTMSGSLGQTAIGPSTSSSVGHHAGFWYALTEKINKPIYIPAILRDH